MTFWRDLNRRTRSMIAGGLGLGLAAAFCLAAGALAFVGFGGLDLFGGEPATADPTATPGASAPAASATNSGESSPVATPTPTPLLSATPEVTATSTATRPPPTRTPAPPTATNSPVPQADLTCFGLEHGGQNSAGEQAFLVNYANQGQAAAPAGFTLSWQPIGPDGPMTAESFTQQELAAGGSATIIYTVDLAPGSYTMRFTIDANSDVPESNEGNNSCQVAFAVLPSGITLVPVTLAP